MQTTTFDTESWDQKSFTERVQQATQFYVLEGMAIPMLAYVFHAIKVALFIAGWFFFCQFTEGVGGWSTLREWFFEPIAFQKAFLWASLVEVLGLSCMSGPLGLRLWPPFTAFLHYLRPGTTKLAPFVDLPIFGGIKRSWLDVALYAAYVASIGWALVQPELTFWHFLPIVAILPFCVLGDKTIGLATRWEHHHAMLVCFLLTSDWIAACKWVQLAIWFWAGVSKLTVAFSYVVPIMSANNPMLKSAWLRRRLFRSFPTDLKPSVLAIWMAHGGTFLEFAAPLTLVWVTEPGPLQWLGVMFFLFLHTFIISNMPLGAVFEWNVLNIYTGLFLFVGYPTVSLFAIDSVPLIIYLVIGLLVLPLLGNLVPSRVSFLVAMRYYAGNWPWNGWFFRDGSYQKLNRLKRAAPLLFEQQRKVFTPEQAVQADATFLAFRTLHLQGRVLGMLLPQATDGHPFREYQYVDGEVVAASILGWNFGDGHLADERLVRAVQAQCQFEEGELRVVCVESQPLLGNTLHWRVVDAKTGLIAEGHASLEELAQRKPWDDGV